MHANGFMSFIPECVRSPHLYDGPGSWCLIRLRDDDRKAKPVLTYLADENAYTRAVLADTEALQDTLYTEMRGRIQEADQSVPVR